MSAATPAPLGATGPRTPEGKAVSSQNATSHGLSSERTVLAHENQDEFDERLQALADEFQPEGPHETFLVARMIDIQWKLDRAQLIENALFELMIEDDKTNSSPEARMARAMMNRAGDPLNNLQRYVSSLERSYHRAHRELIQGRKTQKVAAAKAAQAELLAFLNAPPPFPPRPHKVAQALACKPPAMPNPHHPTGDSVLRL